MSQPSLSTLLEFALEVTYQAGKITLGYFQTGVGVERKADSSPVTIADKTAEQYLRAQIEKYWPDHGMIGEEFGQQPGKGEYVWTIDPIDGTKSFVQGVPIYANLIALTDGKRPLVGVANFPALNEIVYATLGGGCYWNGRRARVSTCAVMKDAVLLGSEIDLTKYGEAKMEGWDRLLKATYIHRTWGDAYGYALVATGRAEIMVDAIMQVWDCGPFQVIMEEAGGTFTDWRGVPTIYNHEAIATNGLLYDETLGLVQPLTQ
ncbi:MAG: inositol monophosphatase family protein [Anaerolineae bacterium]|nr:inositol monophosphatase family protein [Anaerolineae bacterium]